MKKALAIMDRFFGRHLEFRIRQFNVLAVGGAIVSMFAAVMGALNNADILNVMGAVSGAVLALSLLYYSYHTGKYQLCYMVTIVAVFLLLFPILFFTSGGYLSGMPSFFVFAVLFTVFMLKGTKALVMSAVELAVYAAICLIAWRWPQSVHWFGNDAEVWLDILFAFVAVSLVLGSCLFIHIRMYDQQQKKLDEQNTVLAQANRMKSEFLANASHEMRTPLTVTSVNVQTVMEMLQDMDGKAVDPEAQRLLQGAQNEIMRLSRMVGGMLTLASMSENTDRKKLDLSALLQSGVEMLRISLERRGNAVEAQVEPGLSVFGNADLLAQVLANILQNAGAHTQGGAVAISARRQGGEIIVQVRDTGPGIPAQILPRVFERGVSTGGTGFGLYLCKTVVESHGGRIWAKNGPGGGTVVGYTLPFYEG